MTEALNEFFKGQAEVEGKCLVDYAQFDHNYDLVFEDQPVDSAKAIIVPRGSTALVDAIGTATKSLGRKLARLPEAHRPGRVLVVVVTDGGENSSTKFTANQVKALVEEQESKWKWEYVFLGANIDAVATGTMFGFKESSSLTFDTHNNKDTMQSLNAYSTVYRSAGAAAFSDDDRQKAVDKS
jgi:hypothetical protein